MHRTQNQKHKLNRNLFFGRIVQHTQNTAMQENAVGEWQGGHRRGKTLKNQYRLLGDGRAEVQTHEGVTFFVDETSLVDIQGITWHAAESYTTPGTWRIHTKKRKNSPPRICQQPRPQIGLSRFLMNYTGPLEVDHLDRNALNNSLGNLRIVTHKINCNNRKLQRNNTSTFNGLSLEKEWPFWRLTWREQRRSKHKQWTRNPEDERIPDKIEEFIVQLQINGIKGKLVPQPCVQPSRYAVSWYLGSIQKSKYFPNTEEGLRNALAFRDQKHAEIGNFNGH